MTNQGKVERVLREAVAVLVEEVGRDEAVARLETAVAQLRGATPKRATAASNEQHERRRRVGRRRD
jgi:hypothetical protein